MKPTYAVFALTTAAAFLFATGCGKKQETAPTAQDAQKAVEQASSQVQQATSSAASQAGAEAQTLLDKAKSLIADKNWSAALAALNSAAGKQPTADQKSLIDQLIAEAQKAMAGDAASKLKDQAGQALGGLLGGKK